MKLSFYSILFYILLAQGLVPVYAGDTPYHRTGGYGTETEGGLNGYVYHVTHLGNYGSGSFRYALEASYPRLIVFDVGGVVDLDMDDVSINSPHITVAGQTAPSPGITVIKGSINISTHDVVVQHIAVRPGDAGQALQSGWEPDGITTYGADVYNIVFDHCSATWSVDENLSVSGPRDSDPMNTSHDVTLYRCIVAEALANSSHSKGIHSMGTLLHDGVSRISIIGCLYAHNNQRNPLFKGNSSGVFVNNVIYNSGAYAIQLSDYGSDSEIITGKSKAAIAGNVWIKGNDSSTRPFVRSSKSRTSGIAWLEDNILLDRSGNVQQATDGLIELTDEAPLWPESLVTAPSHYSIHHVLKSAGARPADRDPVDHRIVQSVIDGTGRIIDSQDEVGGYPVYEIAKHEIHVPDDFESRKVWLDSLSAAIDTDSLLDTSPLESIITEVNNEITVPRQYDLELMNYPNPFNPDTHIEFSIPEFGYVEITVYDILGNKIMQLLSGYLNAGSSALDFNAEGLSSGIYLCTLRYKKSVVTRKLLLVK